MQPKWYYRVMSEEIGPFTAAQLRKLAIDGQISAETFVRKGNGDWVLAERIVGLVEPIAPGLQPHDEEPIANDSDALAVDDWTISDIGRDFSAEPGDAGEGASTDVPSQPDAVIAPAWSKRRLVAGALATIAVTALTTVALLRAFSGSTPETVVADAEPSVALVRGRFSSGTGFLIEKQILVTNYHVVESELPNELLIEFPSAPIGSRGPLSPKMIHVDVDKDLAFFEVQSPIAPLPLSTDFTFRRGQEIIVIGNPGVGGEFTLQNAVSRGLLSSTTSVNGTELYQLSVSVNPGNSGGPVLALSGEVVGVLRSRAQREEGVAFCVPARQVAESLEMAMRMTSQERASIDGIHRLGTVFEIVNEDAARYELAMATYIAVIENGLRRRASIKREIERAQPEIDAIFLSRNDPRLEKIMELAPPLERDLAVPEALRKSFSRFWRVYLKMDSQIAGYRGSYDEFVDECSELVDDRRKLAESIRIEIKAARTR